MKPFEIRIRELRIASQSQAAIQVVHYGCESIYAVKDRPVGISCITFLELDSRADVTFSVVDRTTEGEAYVLESYFTYLEQNPDARLVHWNMNRSHYGFRALATRYTYLTGKAVPNSPSADRLYDLDDLIAARYGDNYADHPKLYSLAKLNGFVNNLMDSSTT